MKATQRIELRRDRVRSRDLFINLVDVNYLLVPDLRV
jgi:hypothetical protein